WFLFTSAGRVTFCWLFPILSGWNGFCWWTFISAGSSVAVVSIHFCWLFPIPTGDLVSTSHILFLLTILGLSLRSISSRWCERACGTIDGTAYTVTEASIRSALQLDDLNAIDTLTNEEILAGLWDIGEPAFVQAQQQEVSPPPPSPVVAPHPLPDPMPSPHRQSSPPPIPFGPAPSSGVASTETIPDIPSSSRPSEQVLETITSPIRDDDTGGGTLHESPPSLPPATLTRSPTVGVTEGPLTLTSFLALFPTCLQRITTLEAELKATKILHRDTMVLFAKRIKKLESKLKTKKRKLVPSDSENEEEARQSQELDALLHLANAALHDPTTIIYKRIKKQQSSSGLDFTDTAIPATGLDSAAGLDSAGGFVSVGGADSASGLTSAGILVAAGPSVPTEPSSPIRDPAKGKAVAIPSSPERESRASAAQSTQRQAELDRVALNLTNEEWIGLVDQLRANPTLSVELLGANVSEDTFSVRMVELKNQRQKAIAKMKAKAKRDKPMTPAQQKKLKSSHSTTRPAELQEPTSVPAVTPIPVVTPIPAVTSVPAGSSIPAVTPSAAGVSTTAGASRSASDASDVTLKKPSRKKSISRRRSLPSAYKPKSDALPFDEDDPEAKVKKYLRQVSDDDEHAEPVSLTLVSDIRTWEIIPTEFGLGRADLMVLYGMVLDKYKIERATVIGLGLWLDLRTLITTREDRDASIIWDDHDQWFQIACSSKIQQSQAEGIQICSWCFKFHIQDPNVAVDTSCCSTLNPHTALMAIYYWKLDNKQAIIQFRGGLLGIVIPAARVFCSCWQVFISAGVLFLL
nr:hypothetical protein [Tanacetum cinerariifolium]